MDSLVRRLSNGLHRVRATRVASTEDFFDRWRLGYVFIEFMDTEGGTELGIKVDVSEMPDTASETVTVSGELVLNFEPVICTATLDLETLEGQGGLAITKKQSEATA